VVLMNSKKYNGLDYRERCELMGKALVQAQIDYQYNTRRQISQNEFAKIMGVPSTSLSAWINAQRLPVGDNLHKLAQVMGPEVYDIAGEPRRMPDDPILEFIADRWHELSDEAKDKIQQVVTEGAAQEQKATT